MVKKVKNIPAIVIKTKRIKLLQSVSQIFLSALPPSSMQTQLVKLLLSELWEQPARHGERYINESVPHTGSNFVVGQEHSALHENVNGEEEEKFAGIWFTPTYSGLGQDISGENASMAGMLITWERRHIKMILLQDVDSFHFLIRKPLNTFAAPPNGTTISPTIRPAMLFEYWYCCSIYLGR